MTSIPPSPRGPARRRRPPVGGGDGRGPRRERRPLVSSALAAAAAAAALALHRSSAPSLVEALPKPSGVVDGDRADPPGDANEGGGGTGSGGSGGSSAKIFTNLNDNYQSSSSALDAATRRASRKLEDDFKERQAKMRRYWKRTFEEIRESNPVVFGEDGVEHRLRKRRESDEKLLERWKEFLDGGGEAFDEEEGGVEVDVNAENGGDESSPKSDEKATAPLRFDGFQTWEKQLQQWSEDVSLYMEETENQLNELLQPKEKSGYDLSNFGVSSDALKKLGEEEGTDGEEPGAEGGSKRHQKPRRSTAKSPRPTLSQRLGLDATATPIGALPIALTALDRTLPAIPKPRPVTPADEVLPHTDVADKSKNIWIVTTGAFPWMTGTAVNPLLRAAYLCAGRKEAGGSVTLLLPWVERDEDQKKIYGGSERRFEAPSDQEEYIRTWLRESANMKEASEELNIEWYTAWQEVLENSLYSMGDLIGLIPEEKCDICVLEEPEHLNWYRGPGENWTSKFKHVVGIVHTNYFVYATEQPAAFIRAPGMRLLSSWMCRAHCHRLIKLSGTLQQFAPEKELVENVHGVRRTFLDIGDGLTTKLTSPGNDADPVFSADATPTVYFIGKMLWSKGLESLMELVKYAEDSADLRLKIDMYGGGPNKDEASDKARNLGLDMPFHGPVDHSELGWTHKVFVNPSTSEVLCTTVAEALAMGKFVVLPSHPSNDFFAQFPNCLPYSNKEEFVGNLYYALTHSPEPLTEEYSYALSWEAATERFAAAASVSVAEAKAMEEALSSTEAGFDIILPPLTTNEEQRKKISRSFKKTRGRYRNFRARLSQELSKTNVLPKDVQHRLIAELDKRLNVDLDELLDSPKLRVKLSPAKLDKLLLDLYDSVVEGPSGDVFRVVGGGSTVGRQHLYLKQQQSKLIKMVADGDVVLESDVVSTPTSLVKRALKRNLPEKWASLGSANNGHRVEGDKREVPKMSLVTRSMRSDPSWSVRMIGCRSFTPCLPPRAKISPLI